MDSNTSRNMDNSDQGPRRHVRVDISHQIDSRDHVRSYTCSFCKRGFSNAQALGGHMNIHRKDRAKLRQLSDEEEDQENDHNNNNNQEVSLSLSLKEQHLQVSDEEKHCLDHDDKKLAFRIRERKLDASEKITELPFFVGIASSEKDKRFKEESHSGINCEDEEDKLQVMRDGSGSGSNYNNHDLEGLDLELRLGQSLKSRTSNPN